MSKKITILQMSLLNRTWNNRVVFGIRGHKGTVCNHRWSPHSRLLWTWADHFL